MEASTFIGSHVVVSQTSFLGDVVLTTPLLRALKQILRPRRLSVLVRPEAAALLKGHPCVDAILLDDKHGRDRGPRGVGRVARRLRAEGIDVAVSPHRSFRTAAILALAGVPVRIGFRGGVATAFYHATVERDESRHAVERSLELVRAFGASPRSHLEPPVLVPTAEAEMSALRVLGECGVDLSRDLYGVCPGSVWPTKRWSPEGFAKVVRRLAERADATVLLLGGPGDKAVADRVQRLSGEGAINLAGVTDLGTFVALVRRLRALVCNDSAPMHVAGALGTPVVAVFCATTPDQGFAPYGSRSEVVGADLDCRPCGRHGGVRCPRGTEDCMQLVDGRDVLAAVQNVTGGAVLAAEGLGPGLRPV